MKTTEHDGPRWETRDIRNTTVLQLCDAAMHQLLCDDCNPDHGPCEFYMPVHVDGRDMLLTFTATLTDYSDKARN